MEQLSELVAPFLHDSEAIVSTLPHTVSKWLKMDLPTRIERSTGLPVTHIETKQAD